MKSRLFNIQSTRARDCLAVLGLLLLLLLFIGAALLPNRVLMPLDIVTESWPPWQKPNQPVEVNNLLLSDVVNYLVPIKQWVAERIREGTLPLWNPYVLAGYPLTYNTQAGAFYPLMLLYYLLPVEVAVDAAVISQMTLGILFMYGYLRSISLGSTAAMIGTAIFMFNGLMIVWLEWQVVHAAIIWLPLQLLLVERIRRALAAETPTNWARLAIYTVLSGVSLAIPWLGGHWNWTLYSSMTLVVYLLWRVLPSTHQTSPMRIRLAVVAAVLIIALGLSLIQVLPAASYLAKSHRQSFTLAESQERALLNRLVVLFVPNFFGNPVDQNWWGPRNFAETTLYPGILSLLLAALAPFLRRDKYTRFFAVWGTVGLLWSLGGPAYWTLYMLPGFAGLFPSRAAIVVVLCVSVLAAFSVDRLMQGDLSKKLGRTTLLLLGLFVTVSICYFLYYRSDVQQRWSYLRPQISVATVFLIAAGGVLFARRRGLRPTGFGCLAFLTIATDLFWFGSRYNTISPYQGRLFPETNVAQFLSASTGDFRIVTLAEGIVFPPNSSLVERIENLSGYEPGILQRTVDLMNVIERENSVRAFRVLMPLRALNSPVLDALNVKYILSTHDFWFDDPIKDLEQPQVESWITLEPGSAVAQHFVMNDAGLHRLDLVLRNTGDAKGVVTVRVFAPDGVIELAHSDLDAAGIQSAGKYPFFFDPFPSDWGRSFLATVEFHGDVGTIEVGKSDVDRYPAGQLAVKDLTISGDLAFATYIVPRPELAYEDGRTRIYLNEGYYERVFTVPEAFIAETADEALAAVIERSNQLDQTVVLELDGQPPPPELNSRSAPPGRAAITGYQPNEVTVSAEMEEPGFVVLSDTYYPGWRATVDGEQTTVYRADYMLRAVFVPAGQHMIRFTFLPLDFVVGATVSGLMLLATSIILATSWRKRA